MEGNATVGQLLHEKGYEVWTTSPSTPVFDALEEMARRNVGALVVVNGERIAGVFSERDYARKIILAGRSSKGTTVEEIMTREVVTVGRSATVRECLELMTEKRVRHLPVLDEGRLVGVVSIGDAVKSIIREQESLIEQLQTYITGAI
ncbi:MAG TPA: CBS domain-containing protein [Trueperaceae bacterium]